MFASRSYFFSSRRRHTKFKCDWSSDVCSSDLKSNTSLSAPRKPTPKRASSPRTPPSARRSSTAESATKSRWPRLQARKSLKWSASPPSTTASNLPAVPGVLVNKRFGPPVRIYELGNRPGARAPDLYRVFLIRDRRRPRVAQPRQFLHLGSRRNLRLSPKLLPLSLHRPLVQRPRGIPLQSHRGYFHPLPWSSHAQPHQRRPPSPFDRVAPFCSGFLYLDAFFPPFSLRAVEHCV